MLRGNSKSSARSWFADGAHPLLLPDQPTTRDDPVGPDGPITREGDELQRESVQGSVEQTREGNTYLVVGSPASTALQHVAALPRDGGSGQREAISPNRKRIQSRHETRLTGLAEHGRTRFASGRAEGCLIRKEYLPKSSSSRPWTSGYPVASVSLARCTPKPLGRESHGLAESYDESLRANARIHYPSTTSIHQGGVPIC